MAAEAMLVDTHCHLDDPALQTESASIAQALASGMPGVIIVPAVSPKNFEAVRAAAYRFERVFYLLGLHPLYAHEYELSVIEELQAAIAQANDDPKFVGIGEIGLDFYHVEDRSTERQAHQQALFEAQLRIAHEFDLPVSLHARKSHQLMLQMLKRFPSLRGNAHAFSGSLEQARQFADQGWLIGVGGAVCSPKAVRLQQLIKSLPLSSLVLETDAPYMSPPWKAGQPNSPLELPAVAAALARIRGQSSCQDLIEHTYRNVLNSFPKIRAFMGV